MKFFFYLFNVSVNNCGERCNTIDNSYARFCVPNKVKYINVKIFNLMYKVHETRFLVQHKLCECQCGLKESVYNSKQKENYAEFRCECKELDHWDSCECKMWNPSTCNCEHNKACKLFRWHNKNWVYWFW